jgi:ABC-type branched-subunit amino acid transport system permease subunit
LSRWTPAIVLAVLASVPLWVTSLYVLHIFIIAGIFIIAAMSLNLLLGYAGQLSLGHVAFFGIGAYTSALISLGSTSTSPTISRSGSSRSRSGSRCSPVSSSRACSA